MTSDTTVSLAAGRSRLTVARCRALLAALLIVTVVGHLLYLGSECLDLAEDECYYWDWSRQLDISFYSKGPVTSLLMRASCAVLGETPLAVRLAAVLLRAGLTICLWWLGRRLFASERVGLGAALLSYAVPMMLAAGLVMTTDPPYLFLWSLAMCLGVAAVFDGRRWAWPALGAVAGIGLLTKFSAPVWLASFGLFLLIDPGARRALRTRGPWVALLVFLPFMTPVLLWNARHGWVTFRHVGEDIGVSDGSMVPSNVVDFWTGQMGVIGPFLFVLMMAAAGHAIVRLVRRDGPADERRALRFLLCMALPVFLLVLASSFRKHPAANWPAAAYVPLLVLTAHFLSHVRRDPPRWLAWRWLVWPAVGVGLAMSVLAHRTTLLYPLIAQFNARWPQRAIDVRKIDPAHRLHGWKEAVAGVAAHWRPGMLLLAGDYQTTAELAFYIPGQPKTYCAGSYFRDPALREPFSQYDIWLDRRLDRERLSQTTLAGRDAIYVGPVTEELREAFLRVERLPDVVVKRHGLEVRRLEVWRGEKFRGLPWPGWEGRYNK